MADTQLTPDDERQLREAIAGAPEGLKDDFCKCWPVLKRLLQWVQPRLPDVLKEPIRILISVCDEICKERKPDGAS